ncbi:hypothetical protein CAEBREN_24315 [Caenorhabditis brenneri]|uniref:GH18 domain-containing protein n=1 Tax=Caenorhabditis brenneri TaxID=135651 RepID=G0NAL2_CAEBE|nr:hypothetical protein CAEBREN_24315 [Caenorhabditis brenneri]
MSSKTKLALQYDPLPRNPNLRSKSERNYRDSCKSLFVLFLIFLACAPIAYGLATLIVFVTGEGNTAPDVTTTTENYSTTKMAATSSKPQHPNAASCGKRVVGYFTEWEANDVTEKQLEKLTHVIYLFLGIENGTATLGEGKTEKRFLDLKSKARSIKSDLKVMIGLGGHSQSSRFAPLVSDPEKRKVFIDSIANFIDEHYLDGVEIFWYWSYKPDKLNHLKFVRELRQRLNDLKNQRKRAEDYIISIIVPPSISKMNDGYSIVPFYGTFWRNASFPLEDDSDDIWKPMDSAKGPFAVRWNELDRNGWEKENAKFHEKSKTSYIWLPETKHFLTFENERSLKEKAKYIKNHNIGGFLTWAIDQDDEENTLLNVVSSADICSGKDKNVVEYLCV